MEQLFGALPAVLDSLGKNNEVEEAVVFAAWKRCAGGPISERTLPLEFFENRLIVAVADDIWRRHLEDLSPQMVARINGIIGNGTLRFIEFRSEPKLFTQKQGPATTTSGAGSAPESLSRAARRISDPGLRATFLNAATEYLAKQDRT